MRNIDFILNIYLLAQTLFWKPRVTSRKSLLSLVEVKGYTLTITAGRIKLICFPPMIAYIMLFSLPDSSNQFLQKLCLSVRQEVKTYWFYNYQRFGSWLHEELWRTTGLVNCMWRIIVGSRVTKGYRELRRRERQLWKTNALKQKQKMRLLHFDISFPSFKIDSRPNPYLYNLAPSPIFQTTPSQMCLYEKDTDVLGVPLQLAEYHSNDFRRTTWKHLMNSFQFEILNCHSVYIGRPSLQKWF